MHVLIEHRTCFFSVKDLITKVKPKIVILKIKPLRTYVVKLQNFWNLVIK